MAVSKFIVPMWMFGGYVYSWQSAYDLSPIVGYISLIMACKQAA